MSRHDVIEIGSSPHGEDCAQVGEEDYGLRARAQCAALRKQLLREATRAGIEVPESVRLYTKGNAHDFGTYYEVVARFPEDDEKAYDAALWFEANTPERWDAEARVELGLPVEEDA